MFPAVRNPISMTSDPTLGAETPAQAPNGPLPAKGGDVSLRTIHILEKLDDLVHVAVAALLVVIAASVLVYACYAFGRHVFVLFSGPHALSGSGHGAEQREADPFLFLSVEFLSSTLFVVIVLEILRTILTYLQSRRIRDIAEDFLVVGILTIVRKILLSGAYASLTGDTGTAFVQEAWGTMISIGGVLLLVGGLAGLRYVYPDNSGKL